MPAGSIGLISQSGNVALRARGCSWRSARWGSPASPRSATRPTSPRPTSCTATATHAGNGRRSCVYCEDFLDGRCLARAVALRGGGGHAGRAALRSGASGAAVSQRPLPHRRPDQRRRGGGRGLPRSGRRPRPQRAGDGRPAGPPCRCALVGAARGRDRRRGRPRLARERPRGGARPRRARRSRRRSPPRCARRCRRRPARAIRWTWPARGSRTSASSPARSTSSWRRPTLDAALVTGWFGAYGEYGPGDGRGRARRRGGHGRRRPHPTASRSRCTRWRPLSPAAAVLRAAGIPVFRALDDAVRTLALLAASAGRPVAGRPSQCRRRPRRWPADDHWTARELAARRRRAVRAGPAGVAGADECGGPPPPSSGARLLCKALGRAAQVGRRRGRARARSRSRTIRTALRGHGRAAGTRPAFVRRAVWRRRTTAWS